MIVMAWIESGEKQDVEFESFLIKITISHGKFPGIGPNGAAHARHGSSLNFFPGW
jgi:hypothetical protein